MKIALSGYGKMGKAIEKIALEKGHEISMKIDSSNALPSSINSTNTDVVIDFSRPESALENISFYLSKGLPLVVGTTGWYEKLSRVNEETIRSSGSLVYASNFSIGVNLFFKLNRELAKMMAPYKEYFARIEETHHIHKLDAPSGTGISLANDLIKFNGNYSEWVKGANAAEGKLPVISHRIDEVPGTHDIIYDSEIDEILIEHKAKSRMGFAIGAVVAAEWIFGKKGFFNFSDTLGVN